MATGNTFAYTCRLSMLAAPQKPNALSSRCWLQRYTGCDKNAWSLSKSEFVTFMNTELMSFTKNQKDPAIVDRMMKKLDMNNDGSLDFREFLTSLVA
ncbi:UNVERIFIED_CONTAM: hypothetical protein K2H54_041940 [Gekko kuhli]